MAEGAVALYKRELEKIRREISKVVIGQNEVINALLRAIISNGHVLVEGVPGIAKTLLIKTLAKISGCEYSRIQFTVDLLPTDILGLTAYDPTKGFYVIKGPIFANLIIADEINRATPKTQSALLEAMQEKQVTIGNETFTLEEPFFVMANNNPIESAGVYPLPEAQTDRFLFKIMMEYPKKDEEIMMLKNNVTLKKFEDFDLRKVSSPQSIIEIQKFVHRIYLSREIEEYIVDIVGATRNSDKYGIKMGKYIEYGASPRASIGLFIASKADALLNGSSFVTPQNVKNVVHDVLRHRIILNYEGQAEGVKTDQIITEIISKVPVP